MIARIRSTALLARPGTNAFAALAPRAMGKTVSRLALAIAVQSLPVPGGFAVLALDGWGAMLQLLLAPLPLERGRALAASAARHARRFTRRPHHPGASARVVPPCPARRA